MVSIINTAGLGIDGEVNNKLIIITVFASYVTLGQCREQITTLGFVNENGLVLGRE